MKPLRSHTAASDVSLRRLSSRLIGDASGDERERRICQLSKGPDPLVAGKLSSRGGIRPSRGRHSRFRPTGAGGGGVGLGRVTCHR